MKSTFPKKVSLLLLSVALLLSSFTACKEDSKDNTALFAIALLAGGSNPDAGSGICDGTLIQGGNTVLTGDITSNQTLPAFSSSSLSGIVRVKAGATIIFERGAVVFGTAGSALIIEQGAAIVTLGDAAAPVCFTSSKTAGNRAPGDWGGILVIGDGVGTRAAAQNTEGGTGLQYNSGANDNGSSGSLTHTIIEFAGNEVSAGDELNGLSLYVVGSGTTLNYVQVHRHLDDGIESWGGAWTGKYLLMTGGQDDDFDLDEGYTGKVQFLIAQKYPTTCGGTPSTDPHGFEMDGSHSGGTASATAKPGTNVRLSNFTLIGHNVTAGYGARFREGLQGTFSNGAIYGFQAGNIDCLLNGGGGQPTDPTFTNVLVEAAKPNNDTTGGACNPPADGLTAVPVTSLGSGDSDDCSFATKPDYQPAAEAANAAGSALTAQAGDTFFTDNTTYGGMIAGDNWTFGWTVYRAK
ncbi:hypothetical protein EHQ12_03715 [Leptospira gomenensis]|uniref:T9SS C-terminal target domain-containing protein n=1 Tax=Leptospira gomenensis TaxID=2484974 RepID=A0A5F1Y8I6_9LEPT|nr:hypothetical protein [Leptospira gomenensis]TGK31690.1 hypothetical protein EHQ17_12970 [Leptospira gomenensis]TGK41681.1 hypothetical protein EHQ07_16500 [Leptospira gomenensis]TGK43365.1 hypothetical protein EHQ12_03715 [Leptospira gomenensis]TGK61359.1 hypothetical protein EHQ13_08365 [Leptospira gomenensis]